MNESDAQEFLHAMSVIVDDLNFKTESALDMKIAPHFRLWVLLAMIFGILLLMTVVICCFAKIRIPRTKREIELNAASRKLLSGSRKFSCLPCAFTNRKHNDEEECAGSTLVIGNTEADVAT